MLGATKKEGLMTLPQGELRQPGDEPPVRGLYRSTKSLRLRGIHPGNDLIKLFCRDYCDRIS